jgi:hypothetical protein
LDALVDDGEVRCGGQYHRGGEPSIGNQDVGLGRVLLLERGEFPLLGATQVPATKVLDLSSFRGPPGSR